jgi:hypothetical protein
MASEGLVWNRFHATVSPSFDARRPSVRFVHRLLDASRTGWVASNSTWAGLQPKAVLPKATLAVAARYPQPGWLFQVVPEPMGPVSHSSTGRALQLSDQPSWIWNVALRMCLPSMAAVFISNSERAAVKKAGSSPTIPLPRESLCRFWPFQKETPGDWKSTTVQFRRLPVNDGSMVTGKRVDGAVSSERSGWSTSWPGSSDMPTGAGRDAPASHIAGAGTVTARVPAPSTPARPPSPDGWNAMPVVASANRISASRGSAAAAGDRTRRRSEKPSTVAWSVRSTPGSTSA